MKNLIEKQLLEWKEELNKHIQTKNQAQKVLEEESNTILLIQGGIQAKEMLLKKIESESLLKDKEETNLPLKTTRSK